MINQRFQSLLDEAYDKACSHDSGGKQSIWAMAVNRNGSIIAEAGNMYLKSHPLQARYAKLVGLEEKIYPHSEILLLSKLVKLQQSCYAVVIARAGRNGMPMNAAPCPICSYALEEAGINNIFHT